VGEQAEQPLDPGAGATQVPGGGWVVERLAGGDEELLGGDEDLLVGGEARGSASAADSRGSRRARNVARRLPEGEVRMRATWPAGQVTVPASGSISKSRLASRPSRTAASGTGAKTSTSRSESSARTGPVV
jgi:hypothetical protein